MTFSINLLSDLQQMLYYQFMQHAYEAGTIIAVIAGVTGYFVVLRRSAFTAHAFSEIGFAGAAGAVLLNIPAHCRLPYRFNFRGLGDISSGLPGRQSRHPNRHRASVRARIGIVIHQSVYRVCYRSLLYSVRRNTRYKLQQCSADVCCRCGDLAGIGFVYRPLLFASLDEDVGRSEGDADALPRDILPDSSCCRSVVLRASYRCPSNLLADGHPCCNRPVSCRDDLSARY